MIVIDLAVVDIFSVFTAKNIKHMSKKQTKCIPRSPEITTLVENQKAQRTHFDVENWRF